MLSTAYLDFLALQLNVNRQTGPAEPDALNFLRRLATSLELHAVFDEEAGAEERDGAAFVAAESLALLANRLTRDDSAKYRLKDAAVATTVEAALLYLQAGFDSNAATVIAGIPSAQGRPDRARDALWAEWALDCLKSLCLLAPRSVPAEPGAQLTRRAARTNLHEIARATLFREFGRAVREYLGWLCGDNENGATESRRRLRHIRSMLRSKQRAYHSDIYHLAKLTSQAIRATRVRSLRSIPIPGLSEEATSKYRAYLFSRARGHGSVRPRPLFWSTAAEYVAKCLPGPHANAVVAIPTGSGKSFFAELAVSQAAMQGWVVYLVPTNALAAQVRTDLEDALSQDLEVEVQAFLGDQEYTVSSDATIEAVNPGTIAVLTPEKCALALRLNPEAFRTCRLCVFDECHLLAEGAERGALAELVVSHVLALAPDCRVLLMSAMMSNPSDLSAWLQAASGKETEVIENPWRPTRSMRGVVGVDQGEAGRRGKEAWERLRGLGKHRKGEKFQAPHAIVANLQGTWADLNPHEYALMALPSTTTLRILRSRNTDSSGWVTQTAAAITTFLAGQGLSVLTFLPQNKHFPFSVAEDVTVPQDQLRPRGDFIDALVHIAEDELGVQSGVGTLLARGIGVHTGACLDSERAAAEEAFRIRGAVAMLATGTLAQGLNLPAHVVVVGGTNIGDMRDDSPEAIARARSQILNALGRAGRAGFANQGLGLVIPNSPVYLSSTLVPERVRDAARFLGEEENSTEVTSRLERFVAAAADGELEDAHQDSVETWVAVSYLPLEPVNGVSAQDILAKTYAFHRRGNAADIGPAAAELTAFGQDFLQRNGASRWLSDVTYRTGLPLQLCHRFVRALERALEQEPTTPGTVSEWVHFLFDVLSFVTPRWAQSLVGDDVAGTEIAILWSDGAIVGDDPEWEHTPAWTQAWAQLRDVIVEFMGGARLAELATTLLGISHPVDPGRTVGGKPIPKTIALMRTACENLSRVAGALVAVHEIHAEEDGPMAPFFRGIATGSAQALAEVPLTMRFGCNSRGTLAWYRHGVRHRRAAHLMSRLFPVPANVVGGEVRRWIRNTLREWEEEEDAPRLGVRLSAEETRLLSAIRVLVMGS